MTPDTNLVSLTISVGLTAAAVAILLVVSAVRHARRRRDYLSELDGLLPGNYRGNYSKQEDPNGPR